MFRKAMLGDTATLNLDFTTGVLDSRLTFTRAAGTATYINSSGYVTTAAANTPRFDYSPTNIGEPRGLLIEGSAVNIIKNSNAFTSGDWYLGGTPATLTSNYAVGPDGVTGSAWRFQGALTNSVFATPVANGGAAHVVSIYAKSNTGSNQTFTIYNGSSGTTCTATSVWQRFVVPVAGTWGYAYFGTLGASQDILIWGAQSELGTSGASSYIPTGATQVTRNKDSMTLSDLSALGITNTAGTLVADFTNSTENSNYAGSLSFRSAAGSTYAARFRWATTAILTTYFQSNGSTGFTTNLNGSRTSFARCKAATSYSYDGTTTSVFGSMNGAAMSVTSTTTQAASIAIPTSLRWNDDGSTPNATDYPSMVMRSVKYYPTCLTIAQMNTLTTL